MRRSLRPLLAAAAAALAACVGPVQAGVTPPDGGCQTNADCPVPFLCQDGACEEAACHSACDCPAPYGCSPAMGLCAPTPRRLPDGGCPDAG